MRITLLMIFFLGIFACSPCGDEKGANFGLTGLKLTPVRVLSDTSLNNRFPVYRDLMAGEWIRYDSLLLLAEPDLQVVEARPARISFGNAAYACDPAINYDLLNRMTIFTDEQYGDQFDNELFEVGGGLIRPEFPVWHFEGKTIYYHYLIGLRRGPKAAGTYNFNVEILGNADRKSASKIEGLNIRP